MIEHVTVQFSHPDDDGDIARALRAEGLTPLLVNGAHLAATTEAHFQEALELLATAREKETVVERRRFRAKVIGALVRAIESEDADPATFPDDALLLLAEGLVHHGHRCVETVPYCAIRFLTSDPDAPQIAVRPTRH